MPVRVGLSTCLRLRVAGPGFIRLSVQPGANRVALSLKRYPSRLARARAARHAERRSGAEEGARDLDASRPGARTLDGCAPWLWPVFLGRVRRRWLGLVATGPGDPSALARLPAAAQGACSVRTPSGSTPGREFCAFLRETRGFLVSFQVTR